MDISHEDLKHLASLSDFSMSDEELKNVWRDDEIKPMDANREELLALTAEEKNNQIKVPKVL